LPTIKYILKLDKAYLPIEIGICWDKGKEHCAFVFNLEHTRLARVEEYLRTSFFKRVQRTQETEEKKLLVTINRCLMAVFEKHSIKHDMRFTEKTCYKGFKVLM